MSEDRDRRLVELCRALQRVSSSRPGLVAIADGTGAGCTLRLERAGAVCTLVMADAAFNVTTDSGRLHTEAGKTLIHDRLEIVLADGFVWNDVTCASADELAGLLVRHMTRRISNADPGPEPTTPRA